MARICLRVLMYVRVRVRIHIRSRIRAFCQAKRTYPQTPLFAGHDERKLGETLIIIERNTVF